MTRTVDCHILYDRAGRFDVTLRNGTTYRGAALHGSGGVFRRGESVERARSFVAAKAAGRDPWPNVRVYTRLDAYGSMATIVKAKDIKKIVTGTQ